MLTLPVALLVNCWTGDLHSTYKYKHFNKDMILTKMMNKISRTLINVIFVIKNTLKDMRVSDH